MNRQVLQSVIDIDQRSKNFCNLVLKEIELGKNDDKQEIWIETPCDNILYVVCILLKEILEEEDYNVDLKRKKDECTMIIRWSI